MKRPIALLLLISIYWYSCKKDAVPAAGIVTPISNAGSTGAATVLSGDIKLGNQAEVDSFAVTISGRQVQLTGSLIIGALGNTVTNITSVAGLINVTAVSGELIIENTPLLADAAFLSTLTSAGSIRLLNTGLASLKMDSLKTVTGTISLTAPSQLTNVSFSNLRSVNYLDIQGCSALTVMSPFNQLVSVGAVNIQNTGTSQIAMDQLSDAATIEISQCSNLVSFSAKSLTRLTPNGLPIIFIVNQPSLDGCLELSGCSQLTRVNFRALTSVPGKLLLAGTKLADLSGFSSLQTLGSLTVDGNLTLLNLHGLEHLNRLIGPAMDPMPYGTLSIRLGGLYIAGNPVLSTLSGLQNVNTLPVIYISGNSALGDLCPLKVPIISLSSTASISYLVQQPNNVTETPYTLPALTLTNNGSFAATSDALTAVQQCH